MLSKKRLAIVGGGNMGEALLRGLLKVDFIKPGNVFVTDVRTEHLEVLRRNYGVEVTPDNLAAARASDIVLLAVKPQIIKKVFTGIVGGLDEKKVIITIAAGVPTAVLQALSDKKLRIVRVMPNTPALVLEGATAIAAGEYAEGEDLEIAEKIFQAVGKTVIIEEDLMESVTVLSGSGPAYIFLIIEALADSGVKMGLSREVSMFLAAQTVMGAAKMVLETGEHPGKLKDMVTSPGGTAIVGLHTLEAGGLRTTLINAVESATLRSRELGQNQNKK